MADTPHEIIVAADADDDAPAGNNALTPSMPAAVIARLQVLLEKELRSRVRSNSPGDRGG